MQLSFIKKGLVLLCIICCSLSCKKETLHLERVSAQNTEINTSYPQDTAITQFIAPYKKAVDKAMDSVLAFAPEAHSKQDSRYNTAIGNMMADAVFEMANPIFQSRAGYSFDAVLLNYGGMRSSLNKGPITTRTAYEIMPFENEVVVVELSGLQMKSLFTFLEKGTAHPIAGMSIVLNEDGTLKEALVNGRSVADNDTYFIATIDYLEKGGDGMTFFSTPISKLRLNYKLRNVLIDYFQKKDTIAPTRDNRFIQINE